MLKNLSFYILK